MFDNFDDADFSDLGILLVRSRAEVVMSCARAGQSKQPRVLLNFAPAVLDEIGGPRFNVGYGRSNKTGLYAFRVQAADLGRFEQQRCTRGDRRLLRIPVPSVGFSVADGRAEPEFFVDRIGKAILVEVPDAFRPGAEKATPAGAVDASLAAKVKLFQTRGWLPPQIAEKLGVTPAEVRAIMYPGKPS